MRAFIIASILAVAACGTSDEPEPLNQCSAVLGSLCDVVEGCEPSQGAPCRQFVAETCDANARQQTHDKAVACIDALRELQCWPEHPVQELAIMEPTAQQRACVEFYEGR